MHKSARHLPIILCKCINAIRKNNKDNISVFDKTISQKILEPMENELQEEVTKCKLICKKYGVQIDSYQKRLHVPKKIRLLHPSGLRILQLVKMLDEVIWQAEVLCSLGVKEKTEYQNLRRHWRKKMLDTGPQIEEFFIDIIDGAIYILEY